MAWGNLCIDNLATPSSMRNSEHTPLGLIVRERSQAWTDRHGAFACSPELLTSVGLPCPVLNSVASSPALGRRGCVAEPPIISITILTQPPYNSCPDQYNTTKNCSASITYILSSTMNLFFCNLLPIATRGPPEHTEPPLCAYRLRSWP